MATTSGAIAPARTVSSQAQPTSPSGRARSRLLSVVDVVGAYVWGQGLPAVPPSPTTASRSAEHELTQLERIAGPVASGVHPAPVRPGPVDKPSAVAHYQAMAAQVAYERRLADADGRMQASLDRTGEPRELWLVHAAGAPEGVSCYG
jgi:hypothetical protein